MKIDLGEPLDFWRSAAPAVCTSLSRKLNMFIHTKNTIINMAHVSVVKDDNYASPSSQYHTTTFTFHDGTELSLQGPISQLVAALDGGRLTLAWDDCGSR